MPQLPRVLKPFEHIYKIIIFVPYFCVLLLGVIRSSGPWFIKLPEPHVSMHALGTPYTVCIFTEAGNHQWIIHV